MFGWLKKKRMREQLTLIYQNSVSCAYCAGYFQGDGNGDLEVALLAAGMEQENRSIAIAINPNEFADHDQTSRLLEINRTMRRLYDTTAGRHLSSFDQHFVPTGGWDFYFERKRSDGYLV